MNKIVIETYLTREPTEIELDLLLENIRKWARVFALGLIRCPIQVQGGEQT